MAERLKDMFFTEASIQAMADVIKRQYGRFNKEEFTRLVFDDAFGELELKQMMRHTTQCLHQTLPKSYKQAVGIQHKAVMNIPRDAIAQVDGRPVGRDYRLTPHDRRLGFAVPFGHKGVGRHVWNEREWSQLFQASPEELQHQINNGLKVLPFSDGQVRITETAMDEHIARQNGQQSPVALGERIYTPKEAAPLLRLNEQTVRQHLKNGKLGGIKDESGRWWVRQQDIERYLNARKLIHGD